MHYLEKLNEHREEWGKYLTGMGANHTEDLIHDMYLRVDHYKLENKVIKECGKVNKTYVWYILRTVWLAKFHYDKKFSPVEVEKVMLYVESEGFDESSETAFDKLINSTEKAIENSKDETFKRYMDGTLSMRQMAKAEKTGVMDVFYGVKKGKDKVIDDLGGLFAAWKKNDYETIINSQNNNKFTKQIKVND